MLNSQNTHCRMLDNTYLCDIKMILFYFLNAYEYGNK